MEQVVDPDEIRGHGGRVENRPALRGLGMTDGGEDPKVVPGELLVLEPGDTLPIPHRQSLRVPPKPHAIRCGVHQQVVAAQVAQDRLFVGEDVRFGEELIPDRTNVSDRARRILHHDGQGVFRRRRC